MNAFVDDHRDAFGVEPICRILQIAPSGYRRHSAQQRNPTLRSARAQRDERLTPHIERVWQVNLQVYGADKVWRQLNRESIAVARCTVERLIRLWDCAVSAVARSYERRFRIVPSRVQRTRSIGSSRPTVPINYGYPTSPMSRPGRAGFTSPSSSTCSPGVSSAGESVVRCTRTSCSMRWSKRYTTGSPKGTTVWSTIRIGVRSMFRSVTASVWPKPELNLR